MHAPALVTSCGVVLGARGSVARKSVGARSGVGNQLMESRMSVGDQKGKSVGARSGVGYQLMEPEVCWSTCERRRSGGEVSWCTLRRWLQVMELGARKALAANRGSQLVRAPASATS